MKTCPTCKQNFEDNVEFCPDDGQKLRRAASKEDALVGSVLDHRYIVEEKIGEGGMGSVYRGFQKSVGRPVAIKTLRKTLIDSEEFIDRFFREAQIASKINHPNCVTIYEYGHSEDDTVYIAMEFLDGEPLSDLAERRQLSLIEILEIACDTSRALAAAHAFNVVHRDLKPDNIFVVDVPGGGSNAKVLDFGIAKALDAEKSMTRTGMIFGTPEYMSPEQCAGTTIDGRSDLYSLGCILYELVGGRTPFRATTPMAVLMAHVNEAAPKLDPDTPIPPSLDAIIFKLLEKDPEDRFATANDVLEALEHELKVLQGIASGSMPIPLGTQTQKNTSELAFDSTAAFDSSEMASVPKSGGPNKALIGVVLVALIAVVGGVAFMAIDSTDSAAAAQAETTANTSGAIETTPIEIEPIEVVEEVAEPDQTTPDETQTTAEEVAAIDPAESEDEPVVEPKEEPAPKKTTRRTTKKREPRKTTTEEKKVEAKKVEEKTTTKEEPKKKTGTDKAFDDEMNDLLGF